MGIFGIQRRWKPKRENAMFFLNPGQEYVKPISKQPTKGRGRRKRRHDGIHVGSETTEPKFSPEAAGFDAQLETACHQQNDQDGLLCLEQLEYKGGCEDGHCSS
ncbi:unnamed protein product [Citrullus colocynthis]|uniref:Uncharacterized protein n=1 Tax=Citrullus colocynthis TaxID=252529 RepID=A0ABP0YQT4_9ROSI